MAIITNPIIFIKRAFTNLWSHSVGLRRNRISEITIGNPIATNNHVGESFQNLAKTSQIETEGSIKLKMNLNIKLKV